MEFKLDKFVYVMDYIYQNREEPVFKSKIARDLGITYMHVHQIVLRLVSKGMVKRVKKEHDNKLVYIELTDEGMKVAKNCYKLAKSGIADD